MEGLGSELKAAREFQGMSLEDVHHITKISMKFLKALEEGNFSVLPTVYIRAFLKAYAQAVGIDPQKVLRVYDAETAKKKAETEEPEPPPPVKRELKFEDLLQPLMEWTRRNSKTLIYSGSAILALAIVLFIILSGPKGDFKSAEGELAEQPVVGHDGISLSVTALKPIFLLVSIDGGDSLDYNLRENLKKDFRAEKRIWALTSDAGATMIEIAGKVNPKLADAGWSAQFAVDSSGIALLKTYPPLTDKR